MSSGYVHRFEKTERCPPRRMCFNNLAELLLKANQKLSPLKLGHFCATEAYLLSNVQVPAVTYPFENAAASATIC